MEEDDGSGWVKVLDGPGGKGLVPASYIDLQESAPSTDVSAPKALEAAGEFGEL